LVCVVFGLCMRRSQIHGGYSSRHMTEVCLGPGTILNISSYPSS
jgi:hypothetical protein